MTREALLGSDQRYLLLQRTRDVTQLHILARLDAEQHLRYEPRCRLRQTRTQFGGELRQLRFESGPDFGIVHRDASWWLGFSGKKTLLPRIASPATFQPRQAADLPKVRLWAFQILGKLLKVFSLDIPSYRTIQWAEFFGSPNDFVSPPVS